jgi:hypothetical protein
MQQLLLGISNLEKYCVPFLLFSDQSFLCDIIELDLACGWAFGCHWSPSGNSLAFVGQLSLLQLLISQYHIVITYLFF